MKKLLLNCLIILLAFLTTAHTQNNPGDGDSVFETADGKIIGIWPHENKLKSIEQLKKIHYKFGFNYLLIPAPDGEATYFNARSAGYDSTNIMKQIYLPDLIERKDWFWNNIKTLGPVWAYYFDEPISRGFSYLTFLKLLSELSEKNFYPHAKFVIGELDEKKAERFLKVADAIMFSGYGSQENKGEDQAQSWRDWREYLGKQFSMLWISSNEDSLEYRLLFKTAKDLGINSIWLYQYEPMEPTGETSDENLNKFCEAAAEFGFMIRKK